MYINFWYAMAESQEVEAEKPHRVRVLSQNFVLFRDSEGKINCLHDVCTHRGGALSKGKVQGDSVECPYHGWQFNGEGSCTRIPSLGPNPKIPARTKIDAYPTHEEYGLIWAFLGDLPEEERPPLLLPRTNPPGFDYSTPEWRWITQSWPIKANYERSVENALDPAHNEFVHARHGFAGANPDYAVQDYPLSLHEWGNWFMHDFVSPPSTEEFLRNAEGGRVESGGLTAGSGHTGPNNVWTHIHITPTNWMHQYLYETPIEPGQTRAFNINQCNFLDEDDASDDDIREMNAMIAEDDVIVLEEISPITTPPNMTQEVMMPADKSIVKYRQFLRTWDKNGWRIDTDAQKAAEGKKVYAIPSPRRRLEKGWVFDPVPLIAGDQ
ncbi:MAG: aromatic ring-hydroxylating dioxygenase subunit alpha [Pseudomonadales bacterium]